MVWLFIDIAYVFSASPYLCFIQILLLLLILSSNLQYPKSYLPLMSPSHSVSHCDSYTSHCDSYTTDVQRKFLLFCVESLWRCLKSTAEEVHGRFDYRITT